MSKKTSDATQAWLEGLKATGAISDEQWQVLETAVEKPEFVNYVGETALSRSDYSRNMNQLQSDYEAKTAELTDYQRQLANWRGMTEKEVTQIKAEANQLRAERQRIVAVAQSFGLSEDDLGTTVAPHVTNPNLAPNQLGSDPQPNTIDPSKYLSREEFDQQAMMYSLLPAVVNDLASEYTDLFGKAPRGMEQVVQKAIKEKRPLRDVFEDEFKVADKRAELAEQQREAEIKRRVEDELTRYRTEHPEVRIPSPSSSRSFILNNKLEVPADTNVASDQLSSVNAAVSHWNQMDHE